MRFLKNKIARATGRVPGLQPIDFKVEPLSQPAAPQFVKIEQGLIVKYEETNSVKTEPQTPSRGPKSPETPTRRKRESNVNKNIVKNYARAMVNFALSGIATAMVENLLAKEKPLNVNLRGFRKFMEEQKEEVTSIRRLRELLLPCGQDSETLAGYKRVFKAIGMVFIRDFSVNWIYNSKVGDKLTHVKYRFKMLRRVQNPEFFTYIEGFTKK